MQEEYGALIRNGTSTLVPYDSNMKIVGSKWVFRIKHNTNGNISRFKARLVAKGFHQTLSLDFTETFNPVTKTQTIRTIISIATYNGWDIEQIDVNNAFLNEDLSKDVYMAQPEGFDDKTKPDHVCKLNKALYGLKQPPRAWFDKLKLALITRGFNSTSSDPSLFVNKMVM